MIYGFKFLCILIPHDQVDFKLKLTVQPGIYYPPFIIFLFFCLIIALAPSFDLISWAVRYDEKRIVQLFLLWALALYTLFSRQGVRDSLHLLLLLPRTGRWNLAAVVSLGLMSSMLAPSMAQALKELTLFVLLLGFSLLVAILFQHCNRTIIATLFVAIIASAFCYEVTFFTSYSGIFIQGNPLLLPEPFSGFSNIRFFNQFQIWTLPLIVLPLLLYPRLFVSIRGLLMILAVGWWVLLFASQSRGAQLAMALAGIATLLIFRKDAWLVIRANCLAAISGWITYYLLFIYTPDLATRTRLAELAEDPARLQLWQQAWQMVADNPWLGVGPMHYAYYPNSVAAHPHNALLQIAAEWGLPVAIILVALACWGIAAWCTKYFKIANTLKESGQQHLWIGLFFSLIAGLTYSMVSGVIVMPLSQTMFSVIVGLMLGLYYPLTTPVITPTAVQTTVLRVITGMAMVGLVWTVIPDIALRMERETVPSQGHIVTFGPRFWQEGGIPH